MAACGSLSSRIVWGLRTARSSLSPYIRSAATSYLLSRKPNTKNGTAHCLANASSRSDVSALGPHRLYGTSSLAADGPSSDFAGSVEEKTPALVLSDAQRLTIYALSTPPGKAGVAVIRVSGPDALKVWGGVVKTRGSCKGKAKERAPDPWKMHRCEIVHPASGEVLDDGLAVFFRGESCLCEPGATGLNPFACCIQDPSRSLRRMCSNCMYIQGALSYPQCSMPSRSSHSVVPLSAGNSPDARLKAVVLILHKWKV